MLFNSFEFLVFFPVVTILYFILPHKFRWLLLLTASCIFYTAYIPIYILILLFTIVVDYIAGIAIEGSTGERERKMFLLLSIFANVGVLAVFKYYNFFTENVNAVLHSLHITTYSAPMMHLLLPIGLSFHTFQAMSYTIEVYRGNQKAERHFGIYSLYVMFYPQLVAGPLERPQNLIHQFYEKKPFNKANVVGGLQLILWGLFKKVVIADRISLITDPVYSDLHHYPDLAIIAAMLLFPFQVFCDFSGYSDIALGTARVIGFELMLNFNYPYIAKNITEFWRRWHISLSTWFNDYLFKPFVVNFAVKYQDKAKWGVILGLFLTFGTSGLWHGAAWTFIIWGLLHGVAMTYEYLTRKRRLKVAKKMPALLYNTTSQLLTFGFLVFADIFFRANTIRDAFYVFKRIPHGLLDVVHTVKTLTFAPWFGVKVSVTDVYLSILLVSSFIALQIFRDDRSMRNLINQQHRGVRWAIYYSAILAIITLGVFENRQFIYFQF